MDNFVGYVYLITNLLNGKKYVGQTICDVRRRWSQHKNEAKKGSVSAIHAAIRKYGPENFQMVIIDTVYSNREELIASEIRHIEVHDCISPKGYNLSKGGEGVDFSNPEVRKHYADCIERRKEDGSWYKHTLEAARKRASDPIWIASNAERLREMHADPQFREANIERMRRRHADPSRKLTLAIANGVRECARTNKKWLEGVLRGCQKGSAKQEAEALMRDLLVTPEERDRRIRHREASRRCYRKKKEMEALIRASGGTSNA